LIYLPNWAKKRWLRFLGWFAEKSHHINGKIQMFHYRQTSGYFKKAIGGARWEGLGLELIENSQPTPNTVKKEKEEGEG
jgi:hypothetical protein